MFEASLGGEAQAVAGESGAKEEKVGKASTTSTTMKGKENDDHTKSKEQKDFEMQEEYEESKQPTAD